MLSILGASLTYFVLHMQFANFCSAAVLKLKSIRLLTCHHCPIPQSSWASTSCQCSKQALYTVFTHIHVVASQFSVADSLCQRSKPAFTACPGFFIMFLGSTRGGFSLLACVAIHDLHCMYSNGRCRQMCTCATCYWLNKCVIGNIGATNTTRMPHRYWHSLRREMFVMIRACPITWWISFEM